MPLKYVIKHGTEANRKKFTPHKGEIIVTMDTLRLYVGDGHTEGGHPVSQECHVITNPQHRFNLKSAQGDFAYDNTNDTLYIQVGHDGKDALAWEVVMSKTDGSVEPIADSVVRRNANGDAYFARIALSQCDHLEDDTEATILFRNAETGDVETMTRAAFLSWLGDAIKTNGVGGMLTGRSYFPEYLVQRSDVHFQLTDTKTKNLDSHSTQLWAQLDVSQPNWKNVASVRKTNEWVTVANLVGFSGVLTHVVSPSPKGGTIEIRITVDNVVRTYYCDTYGEWDTCMALGGLVPAPQNAKLNVDYHHNCEVDGWLTDGKIRLLNVDGARGRGMGLAFDDSLIVDVRLSTIPSTKNREVAMAFASLNGILSGVVL